MAWRSPPVQNVKSSRDFLSKARAFPVASSRQRGAALCSQPGLVESILSQIITSPTLPSVLKKLRRLSVGPPLTRKRVPFGRRSEEHTSELQSQSNLVCRLLLEKKKKDTILLILF